MDGFRRLVLAAVVGCLAGCASALFLTLLAHTTALFQSHVWLLYLLPVSGALIAWVYQRYGQQAAAGNNLILEQIHAPHGRGVPLRMLPLVLGATLLTHLGGGSAGREGTAVQMGGSIAGAIARWLRLTPSDTRMLLMAGVSAGFGSVFGTPLAGMIFGMEVLTVGGIRYRALLPCLVAAFVGDWTVQYLQVSHLHYHVLTVPAVTPLLVGQLVLAGVIFAGASVLFSEGTHWVSHITSHYIPQPVWRAVVGGLVVIVVTWGIGNYDYNGLSLPLLQQAFVPNGVVWWGVLVKIALTALTLGFGFKGGEVTPLFVIGAMLGSTLALVFQLPTDFMAALGFIAVFAAAANTPLACIVMAVELFGAGPLLGVAITTLVAYVSSGHRGIYLAQRVMHAKSDDEVLEVVDMPLRELRGIERGRWRSQLARWRHHQRAEDGRGD
jgi:H+/Cl- antiporter ClcA